MDFDAETMVTPCGPGCYRADIDPSWGVVRGTNGGYLAAIVLRAMRASVDDDERAPRSLTVHYTSPVADAPVELAVGLERVGRTLTTCTTRVTQGERLVALALGAFSSGRSGFETTDLPAPTVVGPEAAPPRPLLEGAPRIATRWEAAHVIGSPPLPPGERADGSQPAVSGAWLRLPEGHVPDALVVAAATDAWWPPVFLKLPEPAAVPTLDLTIHFRRTLPYPGAGAADYVLGRFETRALAEGFLEEDGAIWSPGGELLAQSRQLAAVLPVP